MPEKFLEDDIIRELSAKLNEPEESISVVKEKGYAEEYYVARVNGYEYNVFVNEDSAYREAVAMVENMLVDEPTLFSEDWLDWAISYYVEDSVLEDVLEDYINSLDIESKKRKEELYRRYWDELRRDAVGFAKDYFGYDIAELLRVYNIDLKLLSENAVDTDGWEHFLCIYDGDYDVLSNGMIYFRVN